MQRTKTGIIGAGRAGMEHAKLYQELPDALLLGIYDTNKEKAQTAAKKLGVIAFDSMEQLAAEVEALSVTVPQTSRFEMAKKLLDLERHVLIEIPAAQTEEKAQELARIASAKNCRLTGVLPERYNGAVKAIEDIPLKPVYIEAERLSSFKQDKKAPSVILDLMLQDIDLLIHLLNCQPTSIEASGASVITSDIDIVNARIEFENGCTASLTSSRLSIKREAKMRFYQRDAQITLNLEEGLSEIFYLEGDSKSPFHDGTPAISLGKIQNRDIKYNRLKRDQARPLKNQLRNFIAAIRNNLPAEAGGDLGLPALKTAWQIIDKVNAQQQKII